MKKAFKCLLLSAVMALALSAAALAADTDPTVTAKNGATVAFQTGGFEKLTASYTDNALADSQCIVLMVKGTEENYTITSGSILYIDQAAADGSGKVTFDNVYPMSVQNSVILLGGPSSGPVVLAEITVPYMLGDTSMDGTIAAYDAVLLNKHLAGIELLTGNGALAADVNKDGSVTSLDAVKMNQFLAGIIKEF